MSIENHHNLQINHMNCDYADKKRSRIHDTWFRKDTVDYWRHERMYKIIKPLASFYRTKKWMSVGDGRYGLDSIRLSSMYDLEVLPTDISDVMLKHSKAKSYITNYSVENAEFLSFEDDYFDVIFCKESLHHCARPSLAIYEMIRVASIAVILIEPNDCKTDEEVAPNFESSGNFVYALSNRELNKIAHAANLGGVAYKLFNDAYKCGVEFEKTDDGSALFNEIKDVIKKADETGRFSYTCSVIFKSKVPTDLKVSMISDGYSIPQKHVNPFHFDNPVS